MPYMDLQLLVSWFCEPFIQSSSLILLEYIHVVEYKSCSTSNRHILCNNYKEAIYVVTPMESVVRKSFIICSCTISTF